MTHKDMLLMKTKRKKMVAFFYNYYLESEINEIVKIMWKLCNIFLSTAQIEKTLEMEWKSCCVMERQKIKVFFCVIAYLFVDNALLQIKNFLMPLRENTGNNWKACWKPWIHGRASWRGGNNAEAVSCLAGKKCERPKVTNWPGSAEPPTLTATAKTSEPTTLKTSNIQITERQ